MKSEITKFKPKTTLASKKLPGAGKPTAGAGRSPLWAVPRADRSDRRREPPPMWAAPWAVRWAVPTAGASGRERGRKERVWGRERELGKSLKVIPILYLPLPHPLPWRLSPPPSPPKFQDMPNRSGAIVTSEGGWGGGCSKTFETGLAQ